MGGVIYEANDKKRQRQLQRQRKRRQQQRIYFSQMAKIDLKLSMVGENFEIYFSQVATNDLKLSTMV